MILSAVRLRCAWCGGKPSFIRGWFHQHESCQSCGISLQRGADGFSLGAATINGVLTLGALVVGGAAAVIATLSHIRVVPIMVGGGILAIVLPIFFFPFTYALWFAVELMMEAPSEQVLHDAEQRRLQFSSNNA